MLRVVHRMPLSSHRANGAFPCPGFAARVLPNLRRSRTIGAMPEFTFRERLRQEFALRRVKNARYSLRAFAAFLGSDHSTLSQILRSKRRITDARIRSWSAKLGLDKEEVSVYLAAARLPDGATALQQKQLRHWTADAMAVVTDRVHWQMLRLAAVPEFRADCRWIAERTGASVDQVNLALATLLRLRLLTVTANGAWVQSTGLAPLTETAFRHMALTRAREYARISPVSTADSQSLRR
jgi:transcriptional regulator with XRE-family HTH domain